MAMTATAPTTLAPTTSRLARTMDALRTRMTNRAARRSADRLERQLMELSEHALRDIGLQRHQIPDVVNEHLTRLSVSLPL